MTPEQAMLQDGKAHTISLLSVRTPPMRAFHMSWLAFFCCFFAWFGIAPLMPIVREELGLSREQVGWSIIASVAGTIFARLLVGWLCDRCGPRATYTGLLLIGSLPVMGLGLARDFESFLVMRLLIGGIGASFVITQCHTSLMFGSKCVGTANATTAGWGNLGGGATQMLMPLLFSVLVGVMGVSAAAGWRIAMLMAGLVCAGMGVAYWKLTQDTPRGNFRELRAAGEPSGLKERGLLRSVVGDRRVWALAAVYGACFGIELTINNIAALYFVDYFGLSLTAAGITAGLFGLMNLFARTLGGYFADRFGMRWGLSGRVTWLFVALLAEGLMLMLFAQASVLAAAIPLLVLFSLFVQMSEGATFAVVPFVNPRCVGMVSGIVGAGGNLGAVGAGFVLNSSLSWPTALFVLGLLVTGCAALTLTIRFAESASLTPLTQGVAAAA